MLIIDVSSPKSKFADEVDKIRMTLSKADKSASRLFRKCKETRDLFLRDRYDLPKLSAMSSCSAGRAMPVR
jgi:hypothetical protein